MIRFGVWEDTFYLSTAFDPSWNTPRGSRGFHQEHWAVPGKAACIFLVLPATAPVLKGEGQLT